jgi:MFS family permease
MPLDRFLASAANKKITAINILLVTNAFVWYYFIIIILQTILKTTQVDQSTTVLIWVLHFAGIAVSAVIGASFAKKIKNTSRFILFWMLLGVALSVISIRADLTSIPSILALSLLFGVSLGLGMPSCMGYFTQNMTIEKRGRVGGIIFFLSGLIIVALGMIAGENIGLQTIILAAWRVFGFIVFLGFVLKYPVVEKIEKSQSLSYKSLLNQRGFLLYLIPWLLFSLIAYLTLPLQISIIQTMQANSINIPSVEYLRSIENILTAISAVVGGFLVDFLGRKRVSIIGFAMLGLSYSLLGIFPENPLSWYFYTAVDGIAWGVLFVIFVVTIWADLSNGSNSEKYYAVGVLPFFLSFFLKLTAENNIVAAIPKEAIFSLTAFLLFLAVLPLIYAPETLPEKQMKDRELKNYIEKAQRAKEKYS